MEMVDSPGSVLSPGSSIGQSDSVQHSTVAGGTTPSHIPTVDVKPIHGEGASSGGSGSQTVQHHPPSLPNAPPTGTPLYSGHNVTITQVPPTAHAQGPPPLTVPGPTSPASRTSTSAITNSQIHNRPAPSAGTSAPSSTTHFYSNTEQSGQLIRRMHFPLFYLFILNFSILSGHGRLQWIEQCATSTTLRCSSFPTAESIRWGIRELEWKSLQYVIIHANNPASIGV